MTRAAFLAVFPEFASTDTALIDAALVEAETLVGDTWGARRDQIVGLEAADRLYVSPMGRNARATGEPVSTYAKRLERLKHMHACVLNRIG
jgi:hypothetical protein